MTEDLVSLMFLDTHPLPKGEIYGWYNCPNCKRKCDGIINDKYCLRCWKK